MTSCFAPSLWLVSSSSAPINKFHMIINRDNVSIDSLEKSKRFDLRFPGGNGSYVRYSELSEVLPHSNSTISVSAWVRYSGNTSKGVFLVLANKIDSNSYDPFIELSEKSVELYPKTGSPVAWPLGKDANDGLWHHIVITFDATTGNLTLYKDGM